MTMRLVRMLGAHGIDPAGLCRRAGVSLEEVSNPHARIPYAHADALLDACVAARGVASFALDLARFADPETYDAAGLVLMSSATFGAGLARALTYQRLWADGARFTLTGEVLRFAHPGPSHTARAILAEVAFVETMLAARGLITPSANALTARFSHAAASGDPNELARALGVTPTFGAPHNELVLGRELLTAPVRVPDGAIASVFDRLARRALDELPPIASLSTRVEALLREDRFTLSVHAVAAYLHLPTRTLQRQLRSEGTSWSTLVDTARRTRVHELERRAFAEKEIAYLIGYSDPSALTRARKRWS